MRKDYRRVLLVCSKISDMICDVNLSVFVVVFFEGGQENILIGGKYFLHQ